MKRLPMPKDTEVILFTVIESGAPFGREGLQVPETEAGALAAYTEDLLEESGRLLDTLAAELGDSDWIVRTRIAHGHIAEQIVENADELGVDHIVVGSHGLTGFHRFLLGSVSRAVVTHAPCSVLVVRKPAEAATARKTISREADARPPMRILAAFDASTSAKAAIELLRSLPLRRDTDLTVVTVLTVATTLYGQDIRQRVSATWQEHSRTARQELESAVAALKARERDGKAERRWHGCQRRHCRSSERAEGRHHRARIDGNECHRAVSAGQCDCSRRGPRALLGLGREVTLVKLLRT